MIDFDEKTHTYQADGVFLPSVTEIVRFLSFDYRSLRPWLAKAAAERGKSVHELCMLEDYGEDISFPFDFSGYIQAYRRFLADYRPQWQLIEHPMGDSSLGYAGTLDRYGIVHGERWLLDIKTGEIHGPSVRAQLYGYESLLEKEGFFVDRVCALKLDKSGIYQIYCPKEPDGYVLFQSCFYLHQALQKGKK